MWCRCHYHLFFALQDALKKLMAEVCDLVPESYTDQCNDFVDKYGVQIVEFLLSSAAPHTICSLLHLCLFNEKPVPGQWHVYHECICPYFVSKSDLYLKLPQPHQVNSDFPEVFFPSDCESCRILAVLSRLHLGLNSTEPQTSSFLQSVCVNHPNAIPKVWSLKKISFSRITKSFRNPNRF